jgi:hypothetical protein
MGITGVRYIGEPLPPDSRGDKFHGILLVPKPISNHDLWQEQARRQQEALHKAAQADTEAAWKEYFSMLASMPLAETA